MENTFIYALCEPGTRTVRYIGKANNPKRRLRQHLRYTIQNETHIGRWLRSLVSVGLSPALVVLAEVSRDSWQQEEIRYIRSARILGLNLTNGTDGGDGCPNLSPEAHAKMSAAKSGENHPMFGKHLSEETIVLLSAAKSSENLSEETRALLSAAKSGKNNPNFGKMGSASSNFGTVRSPKSRAKTSASMTALWARRKQRDQEIE